MKNIKKLRNIIIGCLRSYEPEQAISNECLAEIVGTNTASMLSILCIEKCLWTAAKERA
jgi:hypothetical protein